MAKSKFIYNPDLTLEENAGNNHCTLATVRKHIYRLGIDRRGDEALKLYRIIKQYQKEHPDVSKASMAKKLGLSPHTVAKYIKMDAPPTSNNVDKMSFYDVNDHDANIKSYSSSQDEILSNIMRLYNDSKPFECDLTYSRGVFYTKIPQPRLKYDINPQMENVSPLEEAYTLDDCSLQSIVIDLPFLIRTERERDPYNSKMEDRFSCFHSVEELKEAYKNMLELAYAKLAKGGIIVVKTMNVRYSNKQIWVAFMLMQMAMEMGLECIDEFILTSKVKTLWSISNAQQRHSRKWHSFFYVFRKPKRQMKTKS